MEEVHTLRVHVRRRSTHRGRMCGVSPHIGRLPGRQGTEEARHAPALQPGVGHVEWRLDGCDFVGRTPPDVLAYKDRVAEAERVKERTRARVERGAGDVPLEPGNEEQMADLHAVASGEEERDNAKRTS